jgi:hypothetical protein
MILLVSHILDVVDKRKKINNNNNVVIVERPRDKTDLKQASIYGAGAYALYYFAQDAPEETWAVSYFVFTWKYIGGMIGFCLAIPLTMFAFVMRFMFGARKR